LGEQKKVYLRDTLRLPVRLRRTLSSVIPAKAGIQKRNPRHSPSLVRALCPYGHAQIPLAGSIPASLLFSRFLA
jgi:hypothetical protein